MTRVLGRGGEVGGSCFFQAEDGIRGYKVTGVQTCALPISAQGLLEQRPGLLEGERRGDRGLQRQVVDPRSEERRVGKEWRLRGTPCPEKQTRWQIKVRWEVDGWLSRNM